VEQERGDIREACSEILDFTVAVFNNNRLRFVDMSGLAINMSSSGLCLITRSPLKSGHVIKFKKSVGRYGHAVVMWIKDLGDRYIVGASLVDEGALA